MSARFGQLVGAVPAMVRLFAEAEQLAQTDTSVLLAGEAGTGKHVLARAIHAAGPRRSGPFVALDCGEIAPDALASELFGRPASTPPARAGALELARSGSLLLDEVSDLPLSLQARLESVLAAGALAHSDGQARPLDVRLIAASRRKLAAEVARERFLPALFARLSPHTLALPPLRDRREDIPLLAEQLLAQRDPDGPRPPQPSAALLGLLAQHDWPGNVRELRNVLERALAAGERGTPEAKRLAAMLMGGVPPAAGEHRADPRGPATDGADFEPGLSYREQRGRFESAFEHRYVGWLLDRHDGNVSAAARAAEMDRKYLYKLARKHALKPAT